MRLCNLCGSTRELTRHHVGAQNLIAWFTMWLCTKCQVIFHARQRAAGIDLRFTPNTKLRLIRALKMTLLFAWMLLDMLEKEVDSDIEKAKALEGSSRRGTGDD